MFHKDMNVQPSSIHTGNVHSDLLRDFHAGEAIDGSHFHGGNCHAGSSNLHSEDPAHVAASLGPLLCNFHVTNNEAPEEDNIHGGNCHSGLNGNRLSNLYDRIGKGSNFRADHSENDPPTRRLSRWETGVLNTWSSNIRRRSLIDDSQTQRMVRHQSSSSTASSISGSNFYVREAQKPAFSNSDAAPYNFHAASPFEASMRELMSFPTRRQSLSAEISFLASTGDSGKPYNHVERPEISCIYSNVRTCEHRVKITDIRGREDLFDLDHNAVRALSNMPNVELNFDDNDEIIQTFYPVVERILLQNVPGAQRVFIFDHTVRQKYGDRGPVMRAHVDQTPSSAVARVRRHLPYEADSLLSGRVRLIKFWRPLNGVVENYPLAFADSRTIRDDDLEIVEHRYPDRIGETYGVKYSDGQKWYFWSGMTNTEALLLQCFDSHKGARLAHSAIMDRQARSNKIRESIEVRALVFG